MADREKQSERRATSPCPDDSTPEENPVAGIAEIPTEVGADFAPLSDLEPEVNPDQQEVDPFQEDSLQAQAAFDAAVEAAAAGDEVEAVRQFLRASKIAEVAREWYLSALACERVGEFLLSPKPPCDNERAFRTYRRAVAAYEQCGLFGEARRIAYRQMCLRMRLARDLKLNLLERVQLVIFWAIAGFGYRPLRVIGTASVVVLFYGFLYWALDGIAHTPARGHADIWRAVYFSGITFATVGYGDFVPAPHARVLALTEGFIGAFLLGLFTAVMAGRLSNP